MINGKRALTVRTARELGAAFGTSAEVWLNLEAQWRLLQSMPSVEAVERRARRMDDAKEAASQAALAR